MFIIYDLTGKITGTISGPGREYGDLLTAQNQNWLFYEGATTLDIHASHVDTVTKQVTENKPILLNVNKQQFYANDIDVAIIKGIPLGSNVSIMCNDEPYAQYLASDEELEFATDQIATYKIFVTCHKYIPATITIRSIETPIVPQSGPSGDGHTMSVPDYSNLTGK